MKSSAARLSTKGQIVIPAWVRERLGLGAGDELIVSVDPDEPGCIVLRARKAADVERMLRPAYEWFDETGRDLVEELHEARREARVRERAPRRP